MEGNQIGEDKTAVSIPSYLKRSPVIFSPDLPRQPVSSPTYSNATCGGKGLGNMMDNFLSSRHDGIGISSMTTSTVMYLSEGEEEIVFPRRNVKEAVQRWEREFGTRTTMMTTVDLESSIQQMDDHFHDECDEENTHTGSTQRRPDPPTDDKDDSVTQQLLLPSRSLAASPSTEKRQSQCSFRPDPDERQVRRPPYEWFQPLPSLSSPSTTSSRETHHRCCNSTFIRALCLMVSTGLLMVVFILPWRLQLQTQSSEQQLLHFIDFLAGHGISTRDELLTYESPQYRAAAWSVQRKSDEDALNRYVLAVLYFSLNGDSWPVPFLSDRHVCDWNTQINQTLVGVTGCRRQESGIRVPTQIVLGKNTLIYILKDVLYSAYHSYFLCSLGWSFRYSSQ